MTDLEKMRDWLKGFPGGIPDNFQIDFTNEVPQNAGLFPTGMMEISRVEDVIGNVTTNNQYNFGLYAVYNKPDDVDEISTKNAEWIMSFQQWVQEQSIKRLAPTFGNVDNGQERIKAQNGQFFGDKDKGVGVYMVTITVTFKKYFGG